MNDALSVGTKIKTLYGTTIEVEQWIGGGGQGDVFIVDYNGENKALKWYKPNGMGEKPDKFYENIKNNVFKGAPSEEFLWPLDVTEWKDGRFGYVMNLRPDGYYEVSDYMLTNARFKSYKTIIDAALHIVSAYRNLHNSGFSYQDLNDGNFFINPDNGDVLICDNDNVAPNGTETGIIGKPRYMAPEIVMKKSKPNTLTDIFSMSVILYILFCINHPLEGKKSLHPMSPHLQELLYGYEATFIMDPNDNSNGPDPVVHANTIQVWPYLPAYMKQIFIDSFSKKSITSPNARPKEIDWIKNFVRFRSEIVACSCGNEIFTENGSSCKCESCGKSINIPFKLTFTDYSLPGLKGSRIYKCQTGVCNADNALNPMGVIVAKKDNPTMLGIKNLSEKSWNATTPSGKSKKVMPGDIIPLKDGIVFEINEQKIKIESNNR